MRLCFNKKMANVFLHENTDGFQVRVMKNSQTLRINQVDFLHVMASFDR